MCGTKVKTVMLVMACVALMGMVMLPTHAVWRRDITSENWDIADIRKPTFSTESGYYEEPFMLEIKPKLGGEIYYTLDGSEPNCSKIKYESPILIEDASKQPNLWSAYPYLSNQYYYIPESPIAKAVVVRAVEYYGNGVLGDINTAVYFIGEEMKPYLSIPNLVLVTEPDNLFGYERGIMVLGETYDDWIATLDEEELEGVSELQDYFVSANFRNKGNEWERKVNFQYFEQGKLVRKQEVGIKNRGSGSSKGPTKCFNIYAREEYDKNSKGFFRLLTMEEYRIQFHLEINQPFCMTG